MSDSRWRGWLIAVAIFTLGCAVGAALATVVSTRVMKHEVQMPLAGRGLADRVATRVGDDIIKSLHLTPEEAERVRGILDDSASRMRGIRVQTAQQIAQEMRGTAERIAEALPPEKRDDLRSLFRRRFQRLGLPSAR